jgi:acyl carrier protein
MAQKKNKLGSLLGLLRKSTEDESNEPLSEEVIRQWLIKRLAKKVKIDPSEVDTAKKFEQYGLDSIVAVRISGDLEKLVEQRLSPALLFEHSSIDELSNYLATELGLKTTA